ncbi:MAG: exosortase family protein XrtF [Flavobacteriales bacterium]
MKEYKPLIYFLIKFFVTYSIMTLSYDFYLKKTQVTNEGSSITDPYTKEVAIEASYLYSFMYENSYVKQNENNPYMDFFIKKRKVAIINEGCNAISVMIIMLSFIIAFGIKVMPTILYTLLSLLFVHIVNIFRISILANIIFKHSEYAKLAHDALFPGIIYGAVILICIVWIKFFIFKKIDNE